MEKPTVLIDIDGTIFSDKRKRAKIFSLILNRKITVDEFLQFRHSREIIQKYASKENFQSLFEQYFKLLVCIDERGRELLKLDTPMPYARKVIRKWLKSKNIVYITGRIENMRNVTVNQLRKFNFPVNSDSLFMSKNEEFMTSATKIRERMTKEITSIYNVETVVDNEVAFFDVYRKFSIPERIAITRPPYKDEEFLEGGATKTIKDWKELLERSDPHTQ